MKKNYSKLLIIALVALVLVAIYFFHPNLTGFLILPKKDKTVEEDQNKIEPIDSSKEKKV